MWSDVRTILRSNRAMLAQDLAGLAALVLLLAGALHLTVPF